MAAALDVPLPPGQGQAVPLAFKAEIEAPRYAFVCLMKNEAVAVHLSDQRVTGVLAVCHTGNKAVAKSATQTPPPVCAPTCRGFHPRPWSFCRRPQDAAPTYAA